MRNLSLSSFTSTAIPQGNVSALTIDLEENIIYVASERLNPDTDVEVEVEIIKVITDLSDEVSSSSSLTLFTTTPSFPIARPQVVSLKYLAETRTLALIMGGGDIGIFSLDDPGTVDVVGSVEAGISAAGWSPDDSLLVLITGEGNVVVMTNTFEVLSEGPLDTSDFGDEKAVNVGWGSKQTQFHGSLGKAAAQSSSLAEAASSAGSSPDDDGRARVSWRGDGAFFVISSLSSSTSKPRRILRVFDRQGALQTTSEPVAGLEHPLCWRPSGNLIASTQRFGFDGGGSGKEGRHDVVFFERNGLRHGEFRLREVSKTHQEAMRWGYRVKDLIWSSDSNVLAIWIERADGDLVQLWTTGNYHWYLKHEIVALESPSERVVERFTSVAWHPETPLQLLLTTSTSIIVRSYIWETFMSRVPAPNDTGSVAVVDGSSLLLTPFRTQNIPPPMSSHQLQLVSSPPPLSSPLRTPIHVAFSPTRDVVVILWETAYIQLWDLRTWLGPGKASAVDPVLLFEGTLKAGTGSKQVVIWTSSDGVQNDLLSIAVLSFSSQDSVDMIALAVLKDDEFLNDSQLVQMPGRHGRLVPALVGPPSWQSPSGELFYVDSGGVVVKSESRFPEFCPATECVTSTSDDADVQLCIGLGSSGKLYAACPSNSSTIVLAPNATSVTVASSFLIFVTSAHEAHFPPITSLAALLQKCQAGTTMDNLGLQWEKRRVERGSRIVTAIPTSMSLVLQMPRGNLETIYPRPLVMEVIRRNLDLMNYGSAFIACRKHRVDFDVFLDHNQTVFMENLSTFIKQVDDVDNINLFLTNLGRSAAHTPQMITHFCDAFRAELERHNLHRYVNSILTAFVVKSPPDYEGALSLLLRLRGSEPALVEDAVKYIIFLVDANRLFDTALGMYDFSLVLMIAQHSQKDPREYLPFLRELRALEQYYQRFKIDDFLARNESALRNLSLAGPERFDEAMAYTEKYTLYQLALKLWKNTNDHNTVLELYGTWLFERREFKHAAIVFTQARNPSKALVAHEKALDWRELFDLATREGISEKELSSMGYRVAEDLGSKKRYIEAARVLLDYSNNVRGAVGCLIQSNEFSEARRIITLHAQPELLVDIVHPGALESRAQLGEDIIEMTEQVGKQVSRLRELRLKKLEEPDAFYGVDDTNLHDVDVMTDVSTPGTAFTRYTVAPSNTSRTSKRSSRSKRKMERKLGSGKKGTIDEEEYLLNSVTKLVGRFTNTRAEAQRLLPHLVEFSEEHQVQAHTLQRDILQLEDELRAAIEEIWPKPVEEDGEQSLPDGWAKRMQEKEKERLNAIDKIAKPSIPIPDWNIELGMLS